MITITNKLSFFDVNDKFHMIHKVDNVASLFIYIHNSEVYYVVKDDSCEGGDIEWFTRDKLNDAVCYFNSIIEKWED